MKPQDHLHLHGVKQFYIDTEREEWKIDILCDLYDSIDISQSIIYCKTPAKVEWLKSKMEEKGFAVSAMHGGMSYEERISIAKKYQSGALRAMITTFEKGELESRFSPACFSVLYELPRVRDQYMECIGGAGAFGRKDLAIVFRVTLPNLTSSSIPMSK